jgi:outer membrane protein assembly factor BamB
MKSAGRLLLILSLSIMTGCSTVKGWFSDDDYDPREPVELQKIDEQVKVKNALVPWHW